MGKRMKSLSWFFVAVASIGGVACGGEEPVDETGRSRDAICAEIPSYEGFGECIDCGDAWVQAKQDRLALRAAYDCDGTLSGGGGGGGAGGSEPMEQGCSNAQIRAAQQACEQRCKTSPKDQCFKTSNPENDRYDPFPLGQVIYCAGSNGIHECTVRNGVPVYTCANDLRWCGQ